MHASVPHSPPAHKSEEETQDGRSARLERGKQAGRTYCPCMCVYMRHTGQAFYNLAAPRVTRQMTGKSQRTEAPESLETEAPEILAALGVKDRYDRNSSST
eukprot:1160850-Pelagomonas_calceolata.AAC.3